MSQNASAQKSVLLLVLTIVPCFPACDNGNGGDEDADVQPDPDAVEDVTPEPDAEADDLPVDDGVEDVPEEETPDPCAGTDTLTLEFLDGDENPVEGVAVAMKCLDQVREGTSGTDGRVSFENLNLSVTPVDFTYVHWNKAFSVVGMGGETPIPDPLQIHLVLPFMRAEVSVVGDAVHNTEGSVIMVASSTGSVDLTTTDLYRVSSATGNDLALGAMELSYDGDAVTMLGYSYHGYDMPTGGGPGPEVAPSPSADIRTRALQLDYELATDSPLKDRFISRTEVMGLAANGAFVIGFDAAYNLATVGLTSSWIVSELSDTLEVSWAEVGRSFIATSLNAIIINNPDFTASYRMGLPPDPADWEAAYTVYDIPEIPGQETGVAFPFDQELEAAPPEWAVSNSVMSYSIYGSGVQPNFGFASFYWCVTVHPSVTSFNYSDLPLPTGTTYDDLFLGYTMAAGVAVVTYDEDPAQDAELLANSRCGLVISNFGPWTFKAAASDLRYVIESP